MSANDDRCRFGHHRCRRTTDYIKTRKIDRKILLSTIFYDLLPYFLFLSATLPNTLDRSSARWIVRIHKLHVVAWRGGRLGHQVAVFLPVLPVGVVCGISSSLSYVEKWYKTAARPSFNNVTFCPTLACTTTPRASDPSMVSGEVWGQSSTVINLKLK